MAASKSALKAIKSLIDTGSYEKAATEAQDLVNQDNKNYNGFMFLGFASEKLGRIDNAEKALQSALALKGQDVQACKGLITLFEKQSNSKLDQYHDVVHELARIYVQQDDRMQCQTVIDKYESFAKRHGSGAQYRRALELILPTSDIYSLLEGRVQHPSLTYKRILESTQAEEKDWVNNQISERRTRLGARIDQVTREVQYEAVHKFDIEVKLQQLIDWTTDDKTRHDLEEELLLRSYKNLQSFPPDLKADQRDKVLNTANGMVIIKHPFALAWNIALNWVDAENLGDWDISIFKEYITLFAEESLTKVLRSFLSSAASPFVVPAEDATEVETSEKLSEADQLIMMIEGLEQCPDSMLANRIMALTYLTLQEYGNAAENARRAQTLYLQAQIDYALYLQDSLDATNLILANALIHYQSPRHHPEAKELFNDILKRKPTLTAALLGIGLVLEEDEDYGEAAKFLKQALDRDPSDLQIRLEYSWCHALSHDLAAGQKELEHTLAEIQAQKQPDLAMKSEALYRIAYCLWHRDTSASARKDRSGPYRYLIGSMKANPSYAPAYALLGVYFLDYGKSKQRAKQALQKAFELSTSELTAAERLAGLFAKSGEWDLVELVAHRVVDSGKARPAPGSKKKAVSWPYAALAVVQMNRQQYSQSIVSFQAALRISPLDYHSWVGLGESYHNSGRYVAATRAFQKAESIEHDLAKDQSWFAKYMLANVQREVGAFDEAILAYDKVLEIQGNEYGVLIALLQTCSESAWTKVSQGLFGQAIVLSKRAIEVAKTISEQKVDAFNLWKAVGDACSVIGHVKAFCKTIPLSETLSLLEYDLPSLSLNPLSEVDKVSVEGLRSAESTTSDEHADHFLQCSILAHKRAIYAASNDVHAQAVAWYNLGWAEHQAYLPSGKTLSNKGGKPRRYLKAAVKAFKRAIELEAGNSDFWNALGVVTISMNPKVSQHAFVRSLHLNDHSAKAWTNLGVLYMINNEPQLANEAFTRAQSADPEYSQAWIGQGLLAMLFGNIKEARDLFTHAFEIADASVIPAKRHYAMSAFDHLKEERNDLVEVSVLLQPLFALRQLYIQQPADDVSTYLLSLFSERVEEYDYGQQFLDAVCANVESKYEKSESNEDLARYAQAKADLARAQLGHGDFEAAAENAEMALDLSSEDNLGPAYASQRNQWRLSSQITAGLAYNRLNAMDQSIRMFQSALEGSEHAPDIVCMLAQGLWAKGGQAERSAARSQLFNAVEHNPEHVASNALLAVIGLMDGDSDVLEAVEDDLKNLRMSDDASVTDKIKVSKVLAGIISCHSGNKVLDAQEQVAAMDAKVGIMIAPGQPQGWLELSEVTDEAYVCEMALKTAKNQIPPWGDLSATDLSRAYAHTGKTDDAFVAMMMAPWIDHGFQFDG